MTSPSSTDADDALHQRIQQFSSQLGSLGPTMRSVVARHTAAAAIPLVCAPCEPSASKSSAPAPRFGLMRKKQDPLDKLLNGSSSATTTPAATSSSAPTHWSFRKRSEMHDVSWEAFRQEFGIQVQSLSFRSAGGLHGLQSTSIHPVRCWDELAQQDLCAPLRKFLNDRFPFPTAIQAQSLPIATWRGAVPVVRNGDSSAAALGCKLDLLGIAETGSGKTMCYLMPILQHVLNEEAPMTAARADLGPLSLILVPTRELADQVFTEAERVRSFLVVNRTTDTARFTCCEASDLKIVKIVGGESAESQHALISQGVHLMVGTPGQLDVLLEQRFLSLGNTRLVAIDEADRMVEERMTDQLCNVLQHAPTPRQTIMFTATMLPECQDIATKFLSPRGYFVLRTPYTFQSVWQRFELFPVSTGDADAQCTELKLQRLMQWIAFQPGKQTIVFANEKSTCDIIVKRLKEMHVRLQRGLDEVLWTSGGEGSATTTEDRAFSWLGRARHAVPDYSAFGRVAAAHSGLTQQERKIVIQQFQSGQSRVLVTTDLLARGLDVERLELVINFELPDTRDHKGNGASAASEDLALMKYIHRIGRTGRAGNKGIAVSFVSLPSELLHRSASVMTAASAASAPADLDDTKQSRRVVAALAGGDEDDNDAIGGLKRARDDDESSRAGPLNDERLLAPVFRFLRDCAVHSGATRSEDTFVSECRKHDVARCTIPEPLLLSMQCSSKRMTLGTIRH